ncbi:hypothetical protein AB0J52_32825, partial [Spirillospora sp. NPDC049652]
MAAPADEAHTDAQRDAQGGAQGGAAAGAAGGFPRAGEVVAGLWSFWTRGRRVERACYAVGVLLFLSGLAHLAVYAVDGGPWTGPLSWRKPITFGLSFGLTVVSLTWVTSFVRLGDRARAAVLGV